MYLSKLELLGFKSFAQKTNVSFTDGITSIVGPNGCGKTNIVDAIRWCLGEQRSGALRSDKMENVIFNGTSEKKPMGMAEVSLTIHNTKGILPTEYSEVTITRRIFRSGESEYLLNKNICRLKDITNLFMDTGIGANAYSVIELKMVETILSSKAEERRTMFEEAAGVNKYKLRRRLALRKLEEVKADLNRVNDIVSEVEKKVHSLERQAKKADRYNRISSSLRELEIDLAERELALFYRDKSTSRTSRETDFKKKIMLESDLAELDEKIRLVKQDLSAMEQKLKEKQAEVSLVTARIYNSEKTISVAEEREKSLKNNIGRYKTEIEELKSRSENYRKTIGRSEVSKIEFEEKLKSNLNTKTELEKSVQNTRTFLEGKRNELKAESERLLESIKDITNLENELLNIGKLFNAEKDSINKANEKIQFLTGNIAKTVGYIGELEQEKSKTETEINNTESEYIRKQKEKEDLEKQLDELKTAELENKGLINSLNEKISFIQNLIDNLEGISKGAKVLIANPAWAKGEKILAAHAGSSSGDYRFAIEAALKNNLNNILLETIEDLKSGIEYLRSNSKGKASFYLNRNTGPGKNIFEKLADFISGRKVKAIGKEEGFQGWAADLIQSADKWEPFFRKMLLKTAVVDSFENAFRLSNRYPAFNFTTLKGDYFDSSGIIEAGSLPKEDDSIFGRKQFLEKLIAGLPLREKDLEDIQVKIEKVQEGLNAIDLKVISDQGRLLVNDLANIEKQIAQFQFEMKKSSDEVERIRAEIQEKARESNRLDNEMQRITSMLGIQKDEKERADIKREKLGNQFRNLEEEFNSFTARLNSINLNLERLNGEIKNNENSVKHSLENIESIDKSVTKRNFDISASEEEVNRIAAEIREEKELLSGYNQQRSSLIKEKNVIDEEYNSVREKINELENKRNSIRIERESTVDNIHLSEMKLNELEIKINNLKDHIRDSYSHALETSPEKDYKLDIFNFRERTEEVQTLKEQIKNLGPINLLAYSEFEEERERFEFLTKQRNDLLESEKDIVTTIEEINNTAQAKFTETFEKIRENFINIFRNLFNPGDEADLRLEETAEGGTDPLEAKIEIIAKPKGKRPTSIELLSGGEKTLTAIALLFAIYLVKPSPFCILDEIDAPLDDANIDRFTKIIRDFSKDTQFIVVTHNKRTMEAADTLYGVTMQEEGISKLVSVRFNAQLSAVS